MHALNGNIVYRAVETLSAVSVLLRERGAATGDKLVHVQGVDSPLSEALTTPGHVRNPPLNAMPGGRCATHVVLAARHAKRYRKVDRLPSGMPRESSAAKDEEQ